MITVTKTEIFESDKTMEYKIQLKWCQEAIQNYLQEQLYYQLQLNSRHLRVATFPWKLWVT